MNNTTIYPIEITKYQATDGSEFETKEEAKTYQDQTDFYNDMKKYLTELVSRHDIYIGRDSTNNEEYTLAEICKHITVADLKAITEGR